MRKQHMRDVRAMLERLRKFALFASCKKCKFFIIEVEYLSFIIITTGVTIDRSKVATIDK